MTKKTVFPNREKHQNQLLAWYDTHHRPLPWRALPGSNAAMPAYHVWLSEIMLQQTTVKAVIPYFLKFTEKWPKIQDLAQADLDSVLTAWAGLGYYARARNLHKCAQFLVQEHNGQFPQSVTELEKLPGIGPYTAAAISSIAFHQPAAAVDGNVERVLSRYLNLSTPIADNKKELKRHAESLVKNIVRACDFTQALMELGATVCTPTSPKCDTCPWQDSCLSFHVGCQNERPVKTPKKQKPQRYGTIFVVKDSAQNLLLQKRPDSGLLASMIEFPSTPWAEDAKTTQLSPENYSPAAVTDWTILPETVIHHFTHFTLHLSVWAGQVETRPLAPHYIWAPQSALADFALPSVMQKVIKYTLKENKSFLC